MDVAPSPSRDVPATVSATVRMILRGLLAMLGAWRVEPVIALVLYRRVSRAIGQIERMMVRFRAGRLWQLPHRTCATGRQARGNADARLPRRFGWLVQAGGHQAACVGAQLHSVLTTPEMAELLAVSAQARRILRPLCRALAVEVPGLTGTVRKVPTRRVRPRAVPETFRIALPRGVLAAARLEGFGKDR